MMELRFRVAHPPEMPIYYASWFARTPQGRVHCPEVRYQGEVGEGSFLAVAEEGALEAFLEDMLALPLVPTAIEWRLVERGEDTGLFHARWTEPVFGVPSPMRLLRDIAGPDVVTSLTYHPRVFVVRALIPGDGVESRVWVRLRDGFDQYCASVGVPASLELEHLGPHLDGGPDAQAAARDVLRAAFSLGYYDSPPRASVRDVAFATGQSPASVLAHLRAAEQRILGKGA